MKHTTQELEEIGLAQCRAQVRDEYEGTVWKDMPEMLEYKAQSRWEHRKFMCPNILEHIDKDVSWAETFCKWVIKPVLIFQVCMWSVLVPYTIFGVGYGMYQQIAQPQQTN